MSDSSVLQIGELVEVLWDDAEGWLVPDSVADLPDECPVVTYGVICRLTEKSVFLAGEVAGSLTDGTVYRAVTRVPRAWIQAIRRLADMGVLWVASE